MEVNSFIKNVLFYQYTNKFPQDNDYIDEIVSYYQLDQECPLCLVGLLYDFYNDIDFKYYNRDVSTEIYELTCELIDFNKDDFYLGYKDGLNNLFLALDSYFLAREKRSELMNASFENNTKSSIYRVPMFVSLCESVLMNFYSFYASIFTSVKKINYKDQNTLGKIIPALTSQGLKKSTSINVNIRNSINHGSVIYFDTDLEFSYHSGNTKKTEKYTIWNFDNIIDEYYDLASGIIVGILRVFSSHSWLISKEFEDIFSNNNKESWFKILYHSKEIQCLDVNTEKSVGQVNLLVKTTIQDKSNLQLAIRLLLEGLLVFYPDQEQFMVSYQHPRSIIGFMRFSKSDLVKVIEYDGGIPPKLSGEQLVMLPDIMDNNISIREYNYFSFPEIRENNWYLEKIEIISIDMAKRVKGRLILKKRFKKEHINAIINSIIARINEINLPANPKHKVVAGSDVLGALFLSVFLEPSTRDEFNLFMNNHSFVCLANYYKDKNVTRLKHGGVPEKLWNDYKKNINENVEYAWNKLYKPET